MINPDDVYKSGKYDKLYEHVLVVVFEMQITA